MRREWRELSSLAWPAALAALLFAMLDVVDTAMLGWIGVSDMAGAALGSTIFAAVIALPTGMMTVLAMLIASSQLGRGQRALRPLTAIAAIASLLLGVVASGALLAVALLLPRFGFESELAQACQRFLLWRAPVVAIELLFVGLWALLEGLGDTRRPLLVGALCVTSNIVLNALLIPGTLVPALRGVEGAAVATNIALAIGGVAISWALWRRREWQREAGPAIDRAARLRRHAARFVHLGWPLGVNTLIDLTGGLTLSMLVAGYGSTIAAGHAVLSKLIALGAALAQGTGVAGLTLVARATGAGDRARLKLDVRAALLVQSALGALAAIAVWTYGERWLGLFTSDRGVLAAGRPLLLLCGLILAVDGLSLVAARLLEGMGRTRSILVATLLFDVALGLPAAVLLGGLMGWAGCYLVWLARALFKLVFFARQLPIELPTLRQLHAALATPLQPFPLVARPRWAPAAATVPAPWQCRYEGALRDAELFGERALARPRPRLKRYQPWSLPPPDD